jgi:hypothetical protein
MTSFGRSSSPGLLRGFIQSYGGDLRGWASGIVIRYVIALILLLAAGAGLIAAIGVGANALFHWLDANYGLTVAYEAVIGGLIGMGILSASIGIALLKAAPPRLPRPHHHGRSAAAKATAAFSVPSRSLTKADPATEVMIGLAAACLVGWLVSSRMAKKRYAK